MGKENKKLDKIKGKLDKAFKTKKVINKSILHLDAKSIKSKDKRKDIIHRQKLETRKLKKLQKLKERKIRAEQGENV